MKRGDVVVLNLGGNIGKPRPALVIQNDLLNQDDNLTTTIVLPITSELLNMKVIRYKLEPSSKNGLTSSSQVMIDKIMQIEKSKVKKIIGSLLKKQIDEVEARLLAVLGVK